LYKAGYVLSNLIEVSDKVYYVYNFLMEKSYEIQKRHNIHDGPWELVIHNKKKVDLYERLLHNLALAKLAGNTDLINDYLYEIAVWSNAHIHGEFTSEELEYRIYQGFKRLEGYVHDPSRVVFKSTSLEDGGNYVER
jgi:hypothetical protein